ncbi:MAG TPA: hypothetical protein VM578_07570 [Candidatus Saccharimonadales bacterium]|nr:hypothetical protein [Candidatus Saccharimonadales bacterium]
MKSQIHVLFLASALTLTVSCAKVSPDSQAAGGAANGVGASPTLSTRADANPAPANPASGSSATGNPANAYNAPVDNAPANGAATATYQPIEIPSGTSLSVRLQSSISSASAQPGDRFHAVLNSPLRVHGQTLASSGSEVVGKVVAAEHSGRLEHPGMLSLELDSIQVRGRNVAIQTSRVTAKGTSHKKRNLGWIGGGAGGGALLGGLMGGGKGAAIGAAAGAGAGTATAAATGKHDVAFNVEHQLTFQLRQPVVIQ